MNSTELQNNKFGEMFNKIQIYMYSSRSKVVRKHRVQLISVSPADSQTSLYALRLQPVYHSSRPSAAAH